MDQTEGTAMMGERQSLLGCCIWAGTNDVLLAHILGRGRPTY